MTRIPAPPRVPKIESELPTSPGEPPITREELAMFFENLERREVKREEELFHKISGAIQSMTSTILAEVHQISERERRDTDRIENLERIMFELENARS